MAAFNPGSTVRYMANIHLAPGGVALWIPGAESVYGLTGDWAGLQQAIRSAASSAGFNVTGYYGAQSGGNDGNVQVNLSSAQGGDTDSVKAVLDSAIATFPGATIQASAVVITGGSVPAPIQGDTAHSGETILGNAASFWFDQVGQQVQGLVTGLAQGGTLMWVGIAVVAYIIFSNRR